MSDDLQPDQSPIRVRRWPTEGPLLLLNGLAAAGLWYLLLRSFQSIGYIGVWAAILLLMNVAMIAAVRGSAVRLGPDQFPELHARVEQLARRVGLRRVPDAYLMQQNGALNAFATRFVRSHMIVLFSDLLEACGDNDAARDMIIGHELGHIRAGHLRARWLLMPASVLPFLGSALSRAREYTCDRYGCAAAGDREGALAGLAILSAGGRYGPFVNRGALARQRHDLRTGWMLLGEWLGSHPPLSKRVWALAPELEQAVVPAAPARLLALRTAFACVLVIAISVAGVYAYIPRLGIQRPQVKPPASKVSTTDKEPQVERDLRQLKAFVESERKRGRGLPWDSWDLYARWEAAHPNEKGPIDPFSGYWYDFESRGDAYRIWSTGPDQDTHTADDIVLDSTPGASPKRRYPKRE